jgi:hypothetical protein
VQRALIAALAATAAVAQFAAAPASAERVASACDRACLEHFVDLYLDALIDDNPSEVPLARKVRFTENGQRLAIGDGLWRSMKSKGHYRLFVDDVEAGQVGFMGTIAEDNRDPSKSTPALIALRLRIRSGKITEIEQEVVRDAKAAARVEKMGHPRAAFTAQVPPGQRMSRRAMIETANKYFTGMQQNDGKGDYPFAEDCNRIENGMRTTNVPPKPGEKRSDPHTATVYSAQWSCMEQFKSGLIHFVTRIRDRRFVAVDPERGLVLAFAFFDHSAGKTRTFKTPDGRTVTSGPAQPWTWYLAELFKVQNNKLHQIEAVLQHVPYGMLSGWSSWADGMSDKARDVTMRPYTGP